MNTIMLKINRRSKRVNLLFVSLNTDDRYSYTHTHIYIYKYIILVSRSSLLLQWRSENDFWEHQAGAGGVLVILRASVFLGNFTSMPSRQFCRRMRRPLKMAGAPNQSVSLCCFCTMDSHAITFCLSCTMHFVTAFVRGTSWTLAWISAAWAARSIGKPCW